MGTESAITTTYTLSPAAYARVVFTRIAMHYGPVAAIPLSAAIIYGMYADWRWLVVAAAIIFIAIPTILMFAWIHLLATPGVSEAIFPSRLFFNGKENRLRIVYYPLPEPEQESPSLFSEPQPDDTHRRTPNACDINLDTITEAAQSGSYYMLRYTIAGKHAIHLIPVSAFLPDKATASLFDKIESIK